jgi:flagellar biosynthesis/type III secretory pathway chaperone
MSAHPNSDEVIIAVVSSMKDSLSELMDAFSSLPGVIEQEHSAIRQGRLNEVEAACEQKQLIGSRVDAAYAKLAEACGDLHMFWGSICEGGGPRPATLRGSMDQLQAICERLGADGLAGGVLLHLAGGLSSLVKDFTLLAQKTQPLIEVNKQVCQKLLENYQESFRFWQEVSQETQSTYNASGVQKAKGSSSVLRVKA